MPGLGFMQTSKVDVHFERARYIGEYLPVLVVAVNKYKQCSLLSFRMQHKFRYDTMSLFSLYYMFFSHTRKIVHSESDSQIKHNFPLQTESILPFQFRFNLLDLIKDGKSLSSLALRKKTQYKNVRRKQQVTYAQLRTPLGRKPMCRLLSASLVLFLCPFDNTTATTSLQIYLWG